MFPSLPKAWLLAYLCFFDNIFFLFSYIVTGDIVGHVKFLDLELRLLNWYFNKYFLDWNRTGNMCWNVLVCLLQVQ